MNTFHRPHRTVSGSVDAHLFEEGRVHAQVLGHHVQAEEVSVDAVARHGQPVEVLVLLGGPSEQLSAMLLLLSDHNHTSERVSSGYKTAKGRAHSECRGL